MRLGLAALRGSNPRSSAVTRHFCLIPGGWEPPEMPSGTRRTHGGHGWPPPPVPRMRSRVLRVMPASRWISDLIRPASADVADPDTVHAHLLTAVHQALEPANAPVWIRQRLTTAGL